MTNSQIQFPAASPVPPGYTTVTPWIISPDSAAVMEFMTQAFGAEELFRVEVAEGVIGHAESKIGDAIVMLFDARPDWRDTPAYLRLYVPDCEETVRKAAAAGAEVVTRPTYLPFGDMVARLRDPFGNVWWVHTRIEDLPPEELARRSELPEYVEAMEYVQSAELIPTR